jgi:DNA-binding PadR family transcriptional regulator
MNFWHRQGPDWGGFGFHMGGRKRGRRMRRGILKFVVLKLLEESSRHGYDVMRAFADRGYGPLRAGSVYPILGALEEEGLVTSRAEGDRRVYEITEKGRRHLSEHMSHNQFWENLFQDDSEEAPEATAPPNDLRDAAQRLMQAVGQIGPSSKPETIQRVQDLLNATRKEIYTLLAQE